MTLKLLHSEFPHRWGKFDFLYQCRGIPIAPMLETLLLDEGQPSPHVVHLNCVLQIFNAVLCNFLGCFSSKKFFLCIRLFPLVIQLTFELLDIFLLIWFLWTAYSMALPLSHWNCFFSPLSLLRTCGPGLVVMLLALFLLPWFWQFLVTRSRIHHCCCIVGTSDFDAQMSGIKI